jgi:hypothetical protein
VCNSLRLADVLPPTCSNVGKSCSKCSTLDMVDSLSPVLGKGPEEGSGDADRGGVCAHHTMSHRFTLSKPNDEQQQGVNTILTSEVVVRVSTVVDLAIGREIV